MRLLSQDQVVEAVQSVSFVGSASAEDQVEVEKSVRHLLRTHPDLQGKTVYDIQDDVGVWCCRKL